MGTIAEIKRNEELNGIELYFVVYPLQGTKANLKKYGFRWNRSKKCWYAKASDKSETIAQAVADTTLEEYKEIAEKTGESVDMIGETTTAPKKAQTKKRAGADVINLDNLGENRPRLYGAELAKAIREDLKRRGVKGVTVRARRITYDTGITVTVKATPADYVSMEEAKARYAYNHFVFDTDRGYYNGSEWVYNFDSMTDEEKTQEYDKYVRYNLTRAESLNTYHLINNRADYWYFTTAFYNKLCAVFRIANQWNYDNSDSMTDYFDVGYYLDIDIKKPEDFTPAETMTPEAREAYEAEKRAEAEQEAQELARIKAERAEEERLYKEREEQRKADLEKIAGAYTVEDLTEDEQIYITNLVGGIGKENTLEEVRETAKERASYKEDALITRKVIFKDKETAELFGKYLLDGFGFLEKMGGTATEDLRIDDYLKWCKLTTEQRDSVKMFCNNCVAIYAGDVLICVSNPEGYNYSRYTYITSAETEIKPAKAELETQRKDSESKPAFYFPADLSEQVQALKVGQAVTVYMCDGWILNMIEAGAGIITDIKAGDYAQHSGYYITLTDGRKTSNIFIHNGKKCLIYEGIKPKLPDSITKRQITNNMYEMLTYNELFPAVLDYYNEKPLLDTIQR